MNKEWLPAFGQMTYGIYLLTTRHGEMINGMIASWVSQVSYEPPLIMAALHPNRYSRTLVEKSNGFALHILDRSQKELIRQFKGPDPAKKFGGIRWETKETGAPIVTDCLAWFELKVTQQLEPGNHTLFIGKVLNCGIRNQGSPLSTTDYRGMYTGRD